MPSLQLREIRRGFQRRIMAQTAVIRRLEARLREAGLRPHDGTPAGLSEAAELPVMADRYGEEPQPVDMGNPGYEVHQ